MKLLPDVLALPVLLLSVLLLSGCGPAPTEPLSSLKNLQVADLYYAGPILTMSGETPE